MRRPPPCVPRCCGSVTAVGCPSACRGPVRDWLDAGRALPPQLFAAADPVPLAAEEGAGTVLSSGVAAPEAWIVW
jgi:hypothetical protein